MLVSTLLSPCSYFYFGSETLSSPLFGRYGLVGCDASKDYVGRGWGALCHRHTYLNLACTTSLYLCVCLDELLSPDVILFVMGAE